jgi:hypothetical protein
MCGPNLIVSKTNLTMQLQESLFLHH